MSRYVCLSTGQSAYTAAVSVPITLYPPAHVTSQSLGTTSARVTWQNQSPTAASFNILQSTNGGAFQQVANTANTGFGTAIITGLTAATAYQFEVVAVASDGTTSTAGGPVAVTTDAASSAGYYQISIVPGDSTTPGVIPMHEGLAASTVVSSAGLTITGATSGIFYGTDWEAAVYQALAGSVSVGSSSYAFGSYRFEAGPASQVGQGSGEGSLRDRLSDGAIGRFARSRSLMATPDRSTLHGQILCR